MGNSNEKEKEPNSGVILLKYGDFGIAFPSVESRPTVFFRFSDTLQYVGQDHL